MRHCSRFLLMLTVSTALVGCERPVPPSLSALPTAPAGPGATDLASGQRVDGSVSPLFDGSRAQILIGNGTAPANLNPNAIDRGAQGGGGQFTVDFADTDIREVVSQMLGGMLGANFTIDPAVRGNVTLHTSTPISRGQVLPTLQALLAGAGAALVQSDGLYRVVPAAAAGIAGATVVPLRYTSAEELAKVLGPLVTNGAKISAESGSNSILVSGEPSQVQTAVDLVRSFDVDALSGQSYAVLPVDEGNAKDFSDAMTEAFRGKSGGALAGVVRVVPLTRLNAVLVISAQPRYIDSARSIFGLIQRQRAQTVRSWHVRYLQNSNADDIAFTLQSAFTPNNVTAQPGQSGVSSQSTSRLASGSTTGTSFAGGGANAGLGTISAAGGGLGSSGGGLGGGGLSGALTGQGQSGGGGGLGGGLGGGRPAPPAAPSNPLLGGLTPGAGGGDATPDTMRILPNAQNNAILIYATLAEEQTVEGMLRKIDILPMQVRIDAVIAEVTLNDQLKYGTQFFFKSGGIDGILNTAAQTVTDPVNTVLGATSFPGFFLGGRNAGGAPFAISALQSVTDVSVLSSPQLTVVDNQPARLQVGALVPYLAQTSQSTIASNAPVVNSINYQQTGVIMQVTPRVNSGGLVTLDIAQEVSDVASSTTTDGIQSPTFNERNVTSRVVVQDGQTIGIAGLIRDNIQTGNSGIPWLKDIPILGLLAGTQNNTRGRTELLVLLTPHVIRDQRDARALTEDLRDGLRNAAAVPALTERTPASGSSDPNRRVRDSLRRALEFDPPGRPHP